MGAEVKPGDMQRFVPDPNMKLKKFNFAKYLILSLVTLGIYSIVVLYRFTKTVNILCDGDEKESPNYIVVYLLGIVTLGVYQLYWIYKQAERMQDIAPKYNCTISTSPVSILLWESFGSLIIVGQFIVWHHMFKNINRLIDNYNEDSINYNILTGPTQKRKPIKMIGIIAGFYFLFMLVLPFCALAIRTILITNELEAYEAEREAIDKEELDLPDEKETVGTAEKENKRDVETDEMETGAGNNVPENDRNEDEGLPEKEYYDSTVTFLVEHPGMSENENIKTYGEFTVSNEIYISDWNQFIGIKYKKPAYDEDGNEVGPVTSGKVGYVEGTFISDVEPYIQADRIVLMNELPKGAMAGVEEQDYGFIGVEGTYNEFSEASIEAVGTSVYISEITDNTFWFEIYRGEYLVFARNMATITGSNSAMYSQGGYILNFIWSRDAEFTITGLPELEGLNFINNSYLQVG